MRTAFACQTHWKGTGNLRQSASLTRRSEAMLCIASRVGFRWHLSICRVDVDAPQLHHQNCCKRFTASTMNIAKEGLLIESSHQARHWGMKHFANTKKRADGDWPPLFDLLPVTCRKSVRDHVFLAVAGRFS